MFILEERGNRNNRKGFSFFHQRRWVHINYSSRIVITDAVAFVVIIIIVCERNDCWTRLSRLLEMIAFIMARIFPIQLKDRKIDRAKEITSISLRSEKAEKRRKN